MRFKCIILIILIALLCASSAFALGGAEETSVQYVLTEGVESNSPFRSFLLGLADIFDNITIMASIGVSPFPSMLTTDGDSLPTTIFDIHQQTQAQANKEREISSTIGAIFVSCLIAEILYIAIFKCFLLGDYAIAKQVASVFLRGMLIFFIVINLPIVVELVRTGFQDLAYTIAGARLERDSSMLVMRDNVFRMPGSVIRSSVDIIEMINPANAGGIGASVIDASAAGVDYGFKTLTGMLVQILYWIVQIICVIFMCVCAFHVMFNVIEVYLLIGIVSVLAPFQIFEVTRFLGEKAIYSLFVNLVELFVLMVILYSCQGVLLTFQNWVSETFINQNKIRTTVNYSLPRSAPISEAEFNQITSLANQYSIPWEQMSYSTYTANFAQTSGYGAGISNQNLQAINAVNQKLVSVIQQAETRIVEEAILSDVIHANPADKDLLLVDSSDNRGNLVWDTKKVEAAADSGNLIEQLSLSTQEKALKHAKAQNSILDKYGDMKSEYEIDVDIVPVHLSSGIITVFMMFYFLGQSTQITNALMSGTAATDGFTGATMKLAAGKSLGFLMKGSTMGVKLGGNVKRNVASTLSHKSVSQYISDNVR